MRLISGYFFDLIKGYQKHLELGEDLAQEFREDLDQAVLSAKEKDLADYEAKVHKWEEDKLAVLSKREAKLASDKNVRTGIGLALILCLLTYPFFLLVGRWLPSSGPLSSLLVVLRCGIPVLFAFGTILYLGMLLSYNSNKKVQPKLDPKPEGPKKLYDFRYMMMDEPAYWWLNVGEITRSLHMDENYGSEGETSLVDTLREIVPFDYICLQGALIDKKLDADVILIGHKGIWILESKYYSGKIILNNGSWYRKKTYYEPGGYQNTKEEYLDDFTSQWQREKRAVLKTLKSAGISDAICQTVTGGLVFTHPDAILSIDESTKINIGNIRSWAEVLYESIFDENDRTVLNDDEIIQVADALLAQSEKINTGAKKSLVD